jgi:hypothetical protein
MAVVAAVLTASPASAQDAPPAVVVTGGLDFVNQYNFRGIRQNSEGVSIWPYVDFGFTPFRGDGGLKTVGVNVGSWNASHSQINSADFGTGNKWYESDVYATVGFGFTQSAVAFTYTSYTSPADLFTHVKELAVKLSYDDSAMLGAAALKPYGLVAFELATEPGRYQADGGLEGGRYLELGIDNKFGFFSIGGLATVPMGSHLNVHGGVEFQGLGETTKALNAGDGSQVIGSIGFGFAF